MSVFDFLDHVANGDALFDDKQDSKETQKPNQPAAAPAEDTSKPMIRKHDTSSYPKVELDRRLIVYVNNGRLTVYGQVKNSWHEDARVVQVDIFDKKHDMDESLYGLETDKLLLYEGNVLSKEYPEALLRYYVLNRVTKERDYFQGVYHITYTYDPNTNTYVPNEAKFIRIDDIFG